MKSKRNSFLTSTALQATIVISLCASPFASALNQTWVAAPTDALWPTAANWSGAAAPGAIYVTGNTVNPDVATFNSAIPVSTIGGSASPIQVDLNRLIGGITFDTAAVGAYVIAGQPLKVSHNGALQMNALVAAAQTVTAAVEFRLPSSTNGVYSIRNNATDPNATLTFNGTLTSQAASTRPLALSLDGSNTGNNQIVNILSHGVGQKIDLIKAGVGRWTLSGVNDFGANASATNAGSTSINGGTLILRNGDALSTNSVVNGTGVAINNTGTLEITNNITLGDGLSLNLASGGAIRSNGTNTTNGRINVGTAAATSVALSTVGSGDIFTIGNAANDMTGGASDTITNITGPGTVSLAQAGNYAGGWSVNSGTLLLGTATSLGNTTASVGFGALSTGKLVLNGNSVTIGSLNTDVTVGTPTVENNNAAAATLTVSKASGSNTYAGVLQNGAAVGTLALTKAGASSLTLSGNSNTYSGGTTMSDGTLLVTNTSGSATGTGPLLVNGGILGGAGFVTGAVTVASTAAIAPGNGGVGTLTAGPLTLASGSHLNFDITNTTTLDRITVNGALTINGGQLNINGGVAGFTTNGVYNLIGGYTGAIGGTGVGALSVNSLNQDITKTYTFGQSGGFVTLTIGNSGSAISYWNTNADGNWSTGPWTTPTPNTVGAFASFGGGGTAITAPRTVTVNGAFTVGTLGFNNALQAFTLAAGAGANITLQNTSGAASVANTAGSHQIQAPLTLTSNGANFQVTTLGDTLAVSGVVSGNGPLTKIGNGTLTLTGVNTYTGTTLISGGTVAVNSIASLGDATFLTTIGAATLQATANITTPRNFNITDVASTISVDPTKTYSISGVIGAGAGTLNKAGTGTLVLTGANTYTGGTVVSAGTLNVIDGALGTAPAAPATNLTLNGGTTLQAGAAIVTLLVNRSVVLNGGTVAIDSNTNALTIGGSVSGSSILNKIGAGNLTLNGAGTYLSTIVDAGTLVVGNNAALGSGSVTLNGTSALNLGTRNLANDLVVNGTNVLTSGDGGGVSGINKVTGAGALNLFNSGGNVDFRGDMTAFSGTILYTNQGNVRMNGSTGSTLATFDLGTGAGSLNKRSTAATISLGGLTGGANTFLSGATGSGNASATTFAIGGAGGTTTFAGTIANGGGTTGIMKDGLGTLTLTGTNTYTGTTTVNAGILHIAGSLTATSALNVYLGEAVIDGTGSVTTTVNTGPGTIAGSNGILTVKGTGSHMAAGDLNVGDTGSAVLAATGTLNIQDASTVTLGAAGGLYLGSAFFAGTLANGTVNQTGGTLTHNNPTDGTFVVGGRNFGGGTGTYNLSAGTASSSGKVYVGGAGTGTLNISAIGTFTASAGLLLGNNSNGSTTSAGTVNLNGGTLNAASVSNGAGSGTFNFNGGLLQATAASATFMTGLTAANVQSGGAMINDGGFAVTIGQNLLNGGGGGGLTKTGSGTLTLTGTNTYSGNTTVSGGTLQISNAYLADAANVSITVGAGMKLDFAGSDTVNALTLDGTPKSPGTYGGTGSGATNIDSHFTGTGTLTVTTGSSGSAYGTWAGTFGAGFNATNNGATQDPDNDGIANALEFVLGGNPLTSSTSILPTESLDATNFYFTFNRADASEAEITLKFQYGSTLTGWTDVVIGAASAGQVTVTENGTAPDTVLVTIPRTSAVGGVLFGRLNAVK